MRLNWFSPLLPAKTDIAHYTSRVLPALGAHAEITLWTDQNEWDSALETHARVRRYAPQRPPWFDFNRGDVNFYHVGNNPLFHGPIWHVSRAQPGVVVLHDVRLHQFFESIYRGVWRDTEGYLRLVQRYYGAGGRVAATEFLRDPPALIEAMAERYPLTEAAVENALGVLTHNPEAFAALKDTNRAVIAYAPLPFAAPASAPGRADRTIKTSEPCRLIVFGHIGRNRRLDVVLKALAGFPAKERFQLAVYGQVWDQKYVKGLVRSLRLTEQVRLHGFVPEAELDAALADAHLAINLRYPTMGEASGSQLRIWSHALPSLVTKIGWYAGLPPEAVSFVRPENEVADIQHHLQNFLVNPESYFRMGERGKALLTEQHSPEDYAHAVVTMAREAINFRPSSAAPRLAFRVGRELNNWGAPPGEALHKFAGEINAICSGPD